MKKFKIHWTLIIIFIVFFVLVGSLGVGFFIQKNSFINLLDGYIYEFLRHNWHSKILDALIYPFNFNFLPWGGPSPVYLYFIVFFALIYLWIYKRSLFLWFLFTILIASMVSALTTYLDWHFVFRQRPFLVLPTNIAASAQEIWGVISSFPSGHSRDTAMIATLISSFIPVMTIPLAILTLFVGFSRVYVGAHYPTDVFAGIAIGYLSAKASLILSRELQIIYGKRKGVVNEGKPKEASSDIKKD